MHFIYGIANGSAREAIHKWSAIQIIPRRLVETETVKKNTNNSGRLSTVSTPQVKETVLNEIEEHPG